MALSGARPLFPVPPAGDGRLVRNANTEQPPRCEWQLGSRVVHWDPQPKNARNETNYNTNVALDKKIKK